MLGEKITALPEKPDFLDAQMDALSIHCESGYETLKAQLEICSMFPNLGLEETKNCNDILKTLDEANAEI